MGMIVRGKKTGAALVAGGFAVWFGVMASLPPGFRLPDSPSFATSVIFPATGAACFFLVACFLPEYRERRNARLFLSRRSALEAMAFLVWLTLIGLPRMPEVVATLSSLAWFPQAGPLLTFLTIPIAVLSYFAAKYLIRGFHAVPDIAVPPDRSEPAPPAPSPGESSQWHAPKC